MIHDMDVIYLDSSDYSRLGDPKRNSDTEELRKKLLVLAASKQKMFVFSAAHISEMAPTQSDYADWSTARTQILETLCKRNALISFDKIITKELSNLALRTLRQINPIDTNGTWFPDISEIMAPLHELQVSEQIKTTAHENNFNRNQRRLLEKTLQRKGKIRKNVESKIGQIDMEEILNKYPMLPKNAFVLKNYLLGKTTRQKADEAFLESLRDPAWMMRWFTDHHDRLGAIGDWVRGPATRMVELVSETLIPTVMIGHQGSEAERKATVSLISNENWQKEQDKFLLTITNNLTNQLLAKGEKYTNVSEIDFYCPGLSTCLRVIHDSLRNSLTPSPRKIKSSDFVDAIHSIYLPYVTHFSTDRYMIPIMSKHAEKHKTHLLSGLASVEAYANFN